MSSAPRIARAIASPALVTRAVVVLIAGIVGFQGLTRAAGSPGPADRVPLLTLRGRAGAAQGAQQDGSATFSFGLYDAARRGRLVWSVETFQAPIVQGVIVESEREG